LSQLGQTFDEMSERIQEMHARLTDEIEARQSSEAAVRELNADLAQRIVERTAELETARRELELAGQRERESHYMEHTNGNIAKPGAFTTHLLRKRAVGVFNELVECYSELLDKAVQR